MVGLLRGLLGGIIAAATMAGGLRAIGRGERVTGEGIAHLLLTAVDRLHRAQGLIGVKGGQAGGSQAGSACPPAGIHPFARCPQCGKRGYEH